MLCLPVLLCWRCSDFIDVRPENSPTYTNYFRTLQDAEALLTALQVRVTEMGWRGGIARNGQYVDDDPNEYLTNRLNLMYAQRDWAVFYDAIYQADLILDNAQRFEVKKRSWLLIFSRRISRKPLPIFPREEFRGGSHHEGKYCVCSYRSKYGQ